MIVATMTAEEIHREIMRDYDCLWKRAHVTGKLYQQEMKRKGLHNEMRSLTYKTMHRNEWTITFRMCATWIEKSFHLRTYDNHGMVAYMIQFLHWGTEAEDFRIVKYTSHFFKRYNERMELGFTNPVKLVKYFFKNNFDQHQGETPLFDDGTRYIHQVFNEGMGIGWQDDAKKTLHIKTFIDNDTVSKNKRDLAEHIKYGRDDAEFEVILRPQNMVNKII